MARRSCNRLCVTSPGDRVPRLELLPRDLEALARSAATENDPQAPRDWDLLPTGCSSSGGGHCLIIVGIAPTHLIMHDPLGEAHLLNGITLGGTARFCFSIRQDLGQRWRMEGESSGWAVLAER